VLPGKNYHHASGSVSFGVSTLESTFGRPAQANDDFLDGVSMHRNRGTRDYDVLVGGAGLRAQEIVMNRHVASS